MKASRSNTGKQIEANRATLADVSGTSLYYCDADLFPFMLLTKGIRHLAQNDKSSWLLKTIASMQYNPVIYENKQLDSFQSWCLTVHSNRSAVLTCAWNSSEVLFRTELSATAFPWPKAEIWVQPWFNPSQPHRRLLLASLPNEYQCFVGGAVP